MRVAYFLGCCFLLIFFLPFIPHHETVGNMTIYYPGSLPGLMSFSIICLSILVLVVLNKVRVLNKKIDGKIILRQLDFSYKTQFQVVLAFALVSILSMAYILYYLIVLAMVAAFLFFLKLMIRNTSPAILAITETTIIYKSIIRIKELKIEALKELDYAPGQKMLKLIFTDGLDTISLHSLDFKMEDLHKMVDELIALKDNSLVLSGNFALFFRSQQVRSDTQIK